MELCVDFNWKIQVYICLLLGGGLEKDFTVDDLNFPCDVILVVRKKNYLAINEVIPIACLVTLCSFGSILTLEQRVPIVVFENLMIHSSMLITYDFCMDLTRACSLYDLSISCGDYVVT